jgi:hypothetical protein
VALESARLIRTSADLQELRKLGNIRSIFSGAISAASSPALIVDANKGNLDAQYEPAHGDVPIGRVLPTTSLPKAQRGGDRDARRDSSDRTGVETVR